jgi:hypothetical protein
LTVAPSGPAPIDSATPSAQADPAPRVIETIREIRVETGTPDGNRPVVVQLGNLNAVIIAILLVTLLALVVVSCRRGPPTFPNLRVEVVAPPDQGMTLVSREQSPAVTTDRERSEALELPGADTAEFEEQTLLSADEKTFDLGPSYEEERLAREEAEWQAELAVLQQLLEQNLRLREALGEPDKTETETEPRSEPAAIAVREATVESSPANQARQA